MEIIDFYQQDSQGGWLSKIKESDWDAGQFLYELLKEDKLRSLCGETTKVLLLTQGDELVSFCTFAEEDDVRDSGLTPWIGFVYTFPSYRGHRYAGKLLDYGIACARENGDDFVYISTGHEGLYEKYGYSFYQVMKDFEGRDSRVYRKSTKADNQ